MRILWSIHLYPPTHLCGAEFMTVAINKYLVSQGHEVRVWLHQDWPGTPESMYNYNGVLVFPPKTGHACMSELFEWAQIVVSYLDFTSWSIFKTGQLGKSLVYVAHNTSPYYNDMINRNNHTYVVYNAEHAKEELNYQRPSIVVHPPVDIERVKAKKTGDYITLINICKNKGSEVFYEVAKRMPEKTFLAVKGSYMIQNVSELPNVITWEKQEDISKVYEQTRILLMPSGYESYGLTAANAPVCRCLIKTFISRYILPYFLYICHRIIVL